jgi:serine/threonine-protein kinase HipA
VLSAWPVIGKKSNEIPLQKARLAMALPGDRPRYNLATIQRRHFKALAYKLGLGDRGDALVDELLAQVPRVVSEVANALTRGFPSAVATRIFEGMSGAVRALG